MYSIKTEEARKFWSSKHKCNKMKAIIAFSIDLDNANDNLRRHGYTRAWRTKAIEAFSQYINQPEMVGIPFSEMDDIWWLEMPVG